MFRDWDTLFTLIVFVIVVCVAPCNLYLHPNLNVVGNNGFVGIMGRSMIFGTREEILHVIEDPQNILQTRQAVKVG